METEHKSEHSSAEVEVPNKSQQPEVELRPTHPLVDRVSMQYIRKLRRDRERPKYSLGK